MTSPSETGDLLGEASLARELLTWRKENGAPGVWKQRALRAQERIEEIEDAAGQLLDVLETSGIVPAESSSSLIKKELSSYVGGLRISAQAAEARAKNSDSDLMGDFSSRVKAERWRERAETLHLVADEIQGGFL